MLLLVAALYGLFPVYYVTVQSLKTPEEDVFGNPFYVAAPPFENYTELFEGDAAPVRGYVIVPHVPFAIWVFNSAIVLAAPLAVTLLAGVPAAYALARLRAPAGVWCPRL